MTKVNDNEIVIFLIIWPLLPAVAQQHIQLIIHV